MRRIGFAAILDSAKPIDAAPVDAAPIIHRQLGLEFDAPGSATQGQEIAVGTAFSVDAIPLTAHVGSVIRRRRISNGTAFAYL